MPRERGFTLIELTIAVAIVAMITAAGVGLTLASRSLAVTTAANEFDQLLDSARTIAHEVGGGRLTFAAEGDGTVATFAAVSADGTLVPTTLPALHSQARFAEQEVLGDPAFALVLHADGRLGGIPNAGSAEVGCPAAAATTSASRPAAARRTVTCRAGPPWRAGRSPTRAGRQRPRRRLPRPTAATRARLGRSPRRPLSPHAGMPSRHDALRQHLRAGRNDDPDARTHPCSDPDTSGNRNPDGDSHPGRNTNSNRDPSRGMRLSAKRDVLSSHPGADPRNVRQRCLAGIHL